MNARQQFLTDAAAAKPAEELVAAVMSSLTSDWCFEVIEGEDKDQHKGDIKATDLFTGFSLYLEVKNDGVIGTSGNVLCENQKYFYDKGYKAGNMTYDYEYYCVISQDSRTIYVIDFSILKNIYKSGRPMTKLNEYDITYGYLVSLKDIAAKGGLLKTIAY